MIKLNKNYKERVEKYIFEDNWVEPPLFYNNKGKTLRFNLESKSETKSVELITNIFSDMFFDNSEIFVIFYGTRWIKWQAGKKYFKSFALKRLIQKNYVSKNMDIQEDKPYVVVCLTHKSKFNFNKYLKDYLEDEQSCQIAFLSLKKGTAIQLYDCRGFDVLSIDNDFLKLLYKKYEEYIIEYNKVEIENAITGQSG